MIFMVVFGAFTNGIQGAVRFVIGLECLLYSLNANVGERGGFTAVGADSGSGVVAGVLAGAGVLAVLLRFVHGCFCWRGLLRAFSEL